jgi:hypothetical protein
VPALAQNEQRVSCSSCGFPYAMVRGFCPHCGTATTTEAPILLLEKPRRRQHPLKLTIALLVLVICTFLVMIRRHKIPLLSTQTVNSSVVQNAVASPRPTQQTPASAETASAQSAPSAMNMMEIQDDPAELWKRVQGGSAAAEVALAKLYLAGRGVAQNCEQAHLLLLAASKKHSGAAASNLLSGDYLRRCSIARQVN